MTANPKFIEAILTNNKLNEKEKSQLIAEFIDSIQKEYPDLKYHATKDDVTQTELKLTKEIENVRKEIKEVELKLTKEIESVRKEIKEVDLKLTKEIENTKFTMIRWSFLFWITQFSGIIFLIYKVLVSK